MRHHDPAPPRQPVHRLGLTAIEVGISVAIVATLGSVALGSAGLVHRGGKAAVTSANMQQLGQAMGRVLAAHERLGNDADSADFVADPWKHLNRDQVAAGREPWLQLPGKDLVAANVPAAQRSQPLSSPQGAGSAQRDFAVTRGDTALATHPADAYGQPLRWSVLNQASGNRTHTVAFVARSHNGTPSDASDDIVLYYNALPTTATLDGVSYPTSNGQVLLLDPRRDAEPIGVTQVTTTASVNGLTPVVVTPPAGPATWTVAGQLGLNPGNGQPVVFQVTTASAVHELEQMQHAGNNTYNASKVKLKVQGNPNDRMLSFNGTTIQLPTNTDFTITGTMVVNVWNAKQGKGQANGQWYGSINGSNLTIDPIPPGL
jgi:hypothetical protein